MLLLVLLLGNFDWSSNHRIVNLKTQEQPSHISRLVGQKDAVVILPPLLTTHKLSGSQRCHLSGEPLS